MTDDLELQNLWMALHEKSWRVLAVVAATTDGSSLDVANALADAALQFEGAKPTVIDLRDVKLRFVATEKSRLDEHRSRNESVIVALAAPDRSPAGLALARTADAAVVVVRLGETSMKLALRAAEEIGRDKVVGAIVVKAKPPAEPASAPRLAPASVKVTRFGPPPLPSETQPLVRPIAAAVGAGTVKMVARSGAKR